MDNQSKASETFNLELQQLKSQISGKLSTNTATQIGGNLQMQQFKYQLSYTQVQHMNYQVLNTSKLAQISDIRKVKQLNS